MADPDQHQLGARSSSSTRPLARRAVAVLFALLCLAFVVVTATGCGDSGSSDANDQEQGAGSAELDGVSVALVSPQASGDQGPIDDMISGLDKAKSQGASTKFIYIKDPSAYESTVRSLADSGTKVIIGAFTGFQDPMESLAPDYPDTKFVLVNANEPKTAQPNLRVVTYNASHTAFYVTGYIAALASKSKKVGYVGATDDPLQRSYYNAFALGARAYDDAVDVTGALAGSYEDPAKGHDLAASMYAKGIDVIQGAAAATTLGVVKAAKEKRGVLLNDANLKLADENPSVVLGTFTVAFGRTVFDQIQATEEPGWKGGAVEATMAAGDFGVRITPEFLTQGPPWAVDALESGKADYEEVLKDVTDGKTKVPFDDAPIG